MCDRLWGDRRLSSELVFTAMFMGRDAVTFFYRLQKVKIHMSPLQRNKKINYNLHFRITVDEHLYAYVKVKKYVDMHINLSILL